MITFKKVSKDIMISNKIFKGKFFYIDAVDKDANSNEDIKR